jgi:biotin carboxyl carrier protein
MIKRLRVTVDGHSYDVTVEVPDETNLPAAPAAAATSVAAPNPVPAAVAPSPAAVAPVTASPSAGASGAGEVPSPLAGRVTAVMVTVGQEVKEGDHLVTLEAMKMNTFVFAPKSGKVAEIKSAVGSTVEEGQSLARIA